MTDRVFEFQNIYLSAALLAYKYHYLGVNRTNESHQKFRFTETLTATIYILNPNATADATKVVAIPEASIQDVEQFFLSESLLYPPSYPESLRRVKYILHSRDDNNGDERVGTSSNPMLSNRKPISSIG
jgi:hypothetical protein